VVALLVPAGIFVYLPVGLLPWYSSSTYKMTVEPTYGYDTVREAADLAVAVVVTQK